MPAGGAPPPRAGDGLADPGPPPLGLDPTRHAAAQTVAYQADVLREVVFPGLMSSALALDGVVDGPAYRVYLARLLADAGSPADPVERMLLEQLAVAHFRVGQLHARAGRADGVEATRVLTAAAARLLGEFRRNALALRAYRAGGCRRGGPGPRSGCSRPPSSGGREKDSCEDRDTELGTNGED